MMLVYYYWALNNMRTVTFKTQLMMHIFTASNHNYGDNWPTTKIQELTNLIKVRQSQCLNVAFSTL